MKNKKCEMQQFSDQMNCMTCGQVWDVNDSYPPLCVIEKKDKLTLIKRVIIFLSSLGKNA